MNKTEYLEDKLEELEEQNEYLGDTVNEYIEKKKTLQGKVDNLEYKWKQLKEDLATLYEMENEEARKRGLKDALTVIKELG